IEESTMDSLYDDESNSLSNSDEERNSSGSEIFDSIPASMSTNLPLNSVKKKRQKESNEQVEKARCKFDEYDTEYLWQGSTSNLITHLRDIHNITKESLVNKSKIKVQQQTIQQPIYLVKIDNFRLLIKSFNSHFKVPCVNTIKMTIFDTYTLATKQIIDFISKSSDTVSLTFDIWSSRAHDSYLRITCHWLTDSFELHEIVLEIGELDDYCATDIVDAVQQLGVTNVKCAGHTLQLSVNLGLKQVDRFVSKCKSLVTILSKEKNVATLCISTFYFIKCLVHLKPAIMQLYSTLNNHTLREVRKRAKTMCSFLPSEEEFELLEELIMVLSPFDEATQFLSGSKYPTLGL
ncbi:35656_t:CDS:2, partial [Gigaspora margarita]